MPMRLFCYAVGCGTDNVVGMGLHSDALNAIPDVSARIIQDINIPAGCRLQLLYPADKREEVLAITEVHDTSCEAVYVCYTAERKYRTTNETGLVTVTRHGEAWRDETGDGYVLSLVQQIESLEDALRDMLAMHTKVMDKTNHGASFYDADCLAAMNTVPQQAQAVLDEMGLRNDRNG